MAAAATGAKDLVSAGWSDVLLLGGCNYHAKQQGQGLKINPLHHLGQAGSLQSKHKFAN